MGPEATVQLMARVIALTPADDDADHVPLLVDQNPQVPSRIAALIDGDGDDPGPTLAAMANRLVGAGAEALAMPCNTAHGYAETIRSAAPDVPFLDMVALASDRAVASARSGRAVGMLASPATRALGIYDQALAERGARAIWPTDDAPLLDAIRRLKRDARDAEARAAHLAAAEGLVDRGVDALCIACTEFSLISDAVPLGPPTIDALDALAMAIRDFSLGAQP